MIWDEDAERTRGAPDWTLTGQLLLWPDGSPAHVQQEPFELVGQGWQAVVRVSRSTREGTRWPSLTLRLEARVRAEWEQAGIDARARAKTSLAAYLQLREWHSDDLGVLYLS